MKILVGNLERFSILRNRWRKYWAVWWLRLRGATIGQRVTLGPGVEVTLGKGATLTIHDDVTIKDHTRIYVLENASLSIGMRTFVGHYCELGITTNCQIGADCSIAGFCTLIDSNHEFQNPAVPINKQGAVSAPIVIEDDVWLANKVIILKGVTVGHHSVIGAGAVVTRNIPAFTVAAGVPARPIKQIGQGAKE